MRRRCTTRWGGVNGLYFQLLAQRGIVVWVCDNRSASGKGAESAWVAYKRLGETELADHRGVPRLPEAEAVGGQHAHRLNGWSYGGFMTSYALTHSTSLSMGIAGGTVTDWRNYDSIYTERYMLMPQNNPDGYARTAPKNAAAKPARAAAAPPRRDRRQRPHGRTPCSSSTSSRRRTSRSS